MGVAVVTERVEEWGERSVVSAEVDASSVRLFLFGKPRVEIGGCVSNRFETRRSLLILARLAISRRQTLSRSELADALWPGDFFDATRLRLRQELTRLRRGLGDQNELIVSDGETLRLDMRIVSTDLHDFGSNLKAAKTASDVGERREHLQKAIELSFLPFLEENDEEWVCVQRARYFDLRYEAMAELASLQLQADQPEDALELAHEATLAFPAREPARLLAAQALVQLGHLADAQAELAALKQAVESGGGTMSPGAEQFRARLRPTASSERTSSTCSRFGAPAPVEAIYGREEELERLKILLGARGSGSRLVTLIGFGGIGKTHLLHHACQALAPQFEGRVVLVDLTDVPEPELAPDKILQALRLDSTPTGNPLARVVAVLSRGPALLALDNVEHLGSGMAPIVKKLLESVPQLRIVASGRTALRVPGEFRFEVTPLQLPASGQGLARVKASPAVQMFVSAAAAAGWASPLDEADLLCITEIVRVLEGIPLAIRLGATRLRTLGPERLLVRLRDGVDLLAASGDAGPPRHRSLDAAISSSIDALPSDLRAALSDLAVFRGGWTLEASSAVCGIENPQEVMERLLDTSLIYVATEGRRIRFRMLELIRVTIAGAADTERLWELRQRHMNWLAAMAAPLARNWVGEAELEIFDLLEAETDNLREALHFALNHDPETAFAMCGNLLWFWVYRTTGYEADTFAAALFRLHGDRPPTLAMLSASFAQTRITLRLGDDVPKYCERTLRLGAMLGERRFETRVLVIGAYGEQHLVHYEECDKLIERVEATSLEFDSDDIGLIMLMKGTIEYLRGGDRSVAELARTSAEWFEAKGDLFHAARGRALLAFTMMEQGDYDSAEAILIPLLEQVSRIRFDPYIPYIHLAFLKLYLRRGWHAEAARSGRISLQMSSEANALFIVGESRNGLGRIALATFDLAEARHQFLEAAKAWNSVGAQDAVAIALFGSSAALWANGERARSARIFASAKRRGLESKARHLPFHKDFASDLESKLTAELGPIDVMHADPLEDALRLAGLTP